MRRVLSALLVSMSLTVPAFAAAPEDTIYMDLSAGRVVIETYPDLAPRHVSRIKELSRAGFYDGVVFHRVIDGFMAQTGDPTGTGRGGSDYPDLPAEFNDKNYGRGTVGMARTSDPDSANSQFFICFDDCSFLNGQYTVWGQVTSGMELIDALPKGEPPAAPEKVLKMSVAADVEKGEAPEPASEEEMPEDSQEDSQEDSGAEE